MPDEDEDILDREDEEEQDDEREPPLASSPSITGLPPVAEDLPITPPSKASLTGLSALAPQPQPSITGMEPMAKEQPPEILGKVPAGASPPTSALAGPGMAQPNLAKDVLAGNVTPPQWKDYKPAHVSLARKVGAGLLGGFVGLGNPQLGASITRGIYRGPQGAQMNEDTEQFKDALGQGKLQQAATDEENKQALSKAQTAHLGAETSAIGEPKPVPAEVSKTYVDDSGNEVAVMKDGSKKVLGPAQKKTPTGFEEESFAEYQKAHPGATRLDFDKAKADATRAPKDNSGKEDARADRSYQFHSTQLEKLRTPIETRMERIGIAIDNLNQKSPQADALAAPEILTALVGGQGSGLRMNEAEISRIIGGATKWEQLHAALNKWSLDPTHATFTDEQRGQMQTILGKAREKITAKQKIIEDAEDKLADSTDPKEHRRILADSRKKLDQIDSGGAGGEAPPRPKGVPDNAEWNRDTRHWVVK